METLSAGGESSIGDLGSSLPGRRIVNIVTEPVARGLGRGRGVLPVAAGSLTLALAAACGLLQGCPVQAQSHAPSESPGVHATLPSFDVATIRRSRSGNGMMAWTGDGINISGFPLQPMMLEAFGVEESQMIGAPDWVRSDRFDIQAKVAPEDAEAFSRVSAGDRDAMLLPLLQDRLHLRYHHETRQMPIYTLVVAKGGPRLTRSPEDAAMTDPAAGLKHRSMMMWRGRGNLEAEGMSVEDLAGQLSGVLRHRVEDRTSLTGHYDFKLRWTPDDAPPTGGVNSGQPAEDLPPALSTALEEELGLKLESARAGVDVVVIDHIEPPAD